MQDKIKKAIKHSIDSIDDIDDIFEDFFEDLPETTKDVQKRSRVVLKKIKGRLNDSLKDADVIADEAQLQAHLGLMEARDRLEASRPVMEEFIEQAQDRSRQLMDEAQLQGHLAAMEAEDYWERDGRDIAKKFADSSDDMLQMASETITDLQSRLSDWAETLRNSRS